LDRLFVTFANSHSKSTNQIAPRPLKVNTIFQSRRAYFGMPVRVVNVCKAP
jgi:hypothetical protein